MNFHFLALNDSLLFSVVRQVLWPQFWVWPLGTMTYYLRHLSSDWQDKTPTAERQLDYESGQCWTWEGIEAPQPFLARRLSASVDKIYQVMIFWDEAWGIPLLENILLNLLLGWLVVYFENYGAFCQIYFLRIITSHQCIGKQYSEVPI